MNQGARALVSLSLYISHTPTPIFKFILFIQSKIHARNKNIECDRDSFLFILKIVDSCDRFISLCILQFGVAYFAATMKSCDD